MKGIKFMAIALVTIMLASAFAGIVNASVEHPNVEPTKETNDPIDVENRGIEAQHSEPSNDIDHRTIRDVRECEFERERAYHEPQRLEHELPWRDGEDAHGERFGDLEHLYTHAFEDERYFEELYLDTEFDRDRLPTREFTPAAAPEIDWARYEAHDPIYINGNSDFASQAASEGWAGDGTEGNPYVIEGYDINASTNTTNGIYIRDTDVYFIIRNCVIHDAYKHTNDIYNHGIYFSLVRNGNVEICEIYNNDFGIELYYFSSNNTLTSNRIYNNSNAIELDSSSNNNISSNQIYNNHDGIELHHSSSNTITSNQIYNNSFVGVHLYHSSNNTITSNRVHNNTELCIWLSDSSNNSISTNQIYNSYYGIEHSFSSNNTITSNHIHSNFRGVGLIYSWDHEIHYNNIYNNSDYGIYNWNTVVGYQANATHNWWGSANGPGQDGANGVYGAVLYDPWLAEPWGELNHPPTASFVYSPSSPTTSDTVQFTDTSTDSDGTVVSWSWEFGDGATATAQNPTHQYSNEGTYLVNLTVTDDGGASGGCQVTVTVGTGDNTPPTASFTITPTSGDTSKWFYVDASGSCDAEDALADLQVRWDWENDGVWDSPSDDGYTTTKTAGHRYGYAAGTYTIKLEVIDTSGLIGTTTKDLVVSELTEDSYEENDVSGDAVEMTMGHYPSLKCVDDDWYKVNKPAGKYLQVSIYFSPEYGDLDLYAYDNDATTLIQASDSVGDNHEQVIITDAQGSGWFYIKVCGKSGATNSYNMDITLYEGGAPTLSGSIYANPTEIVSGGTATIYVYVLYQMGQVSADIVLTSDGGGSFSPSSGSVTDEDQPFTSTFTAPSVDIASEIRITATASKEGYNDASRFIDVFVYREISITPLMGTTDMQQGGKLNCYFYVYSQDTALNGVTLDMYPSTSASPDNSLTPTASRNFEGVDGIVAVSYDLPQNAQYFSVEVMDVKYLTHSIPFTISQNPVTYDLNKRSAAMALGSTKAAGVTFKGVHVEAESSTTVIFDSTGRVVSAVDLENELLAGIGLAASLKATVGPLEAKVAGVEATFGTFYERCLKAEDVSQQEELITLLVTRICLQLISDTIVVLRPLADIALGQIDGSLWGDTYSDSSSNSYKGGGAYISVQGCVGPKLSVNQGGEYKGRKYSSLTDFTLLEACIEGGLTIKVGLKLYNSGKVGLVASSTMELSGKASLVCLGEIGAGTALTLTIELICEDFDSFISWKTSGQSYPTGIKIKIGREMKGHVNEAPIINGFLNFLAPLKKLESAGLSATETVIEGEFTQEFLDENEDVAQYLRTGGINFGLVDCIAKALATKGYPGWKYSISAIKGYNFCLGLGLGAGPFEIDLSVNAYENKMYLVEEGIIYRGKHLPTVTYDAMPQYPDIASYIVNHFKIEALFDAVVPKLSVNWNSPINVTIVSENGSVIGYKDGTYVNEIPGAYGYSGAHGSYSMPLGHYTIKAEGVANGTYTLQILNYSRSDIKIFTISNVTVDRSTEDYFWIKDKFDILMNENKTYNISFTQKTNTTRTHATIRAIENIKGTKYSYSVMDWENLTSPSSSAIQIYIDRNNDDVFEKNISIPSNATWDYVKNLLNSPPILRNITATPNTGNTETEFTFRITYLDFDGDMPVYVKVIIDGASYDMTLISGAYTTGALYQYTTTLTAGDHTYYFECDDGTGTSTSTGITNTFTLTVREQEAAAAAAEEEPEKVPPALPYIYIIAIIIIVIVVISAIALRKKKSGKKGDEAPPKEESPTKEEE